jgi:hypothetical protein
MQRSPPEDPIARHTRKLGCTEQQVERHMSRGKRPQAVDDYARGDMTGCPGRAECEMGGGSQITRQRASYGLTACAMLKSSQGEGHGKGQSAARP